MAVLNKRALRPGERIRVLVVDDSVVIRTLVRQVLEQDAAIDVVGTASDGAIGLTRITETNPDVITLDIEMPEMDGLEMLRCIRKSHPRVRVIMFSTLTERGAAKTFEALSRGADDYVTKASNVGSLDRSMARLRDDLIPKIKQFFEFTATAGPAPKMDCVREVRMNGLSTRSDLPKVVLIGSSTGGPTALQEILTRLPANFPLPTLVVQHMPALFTRLLAERLNATCQVPCAEAADGEPVRAGRIFVAPGDFHMKVVARAHGVSISLDQSPPLNSCRPAVDALFSSAAEVYGASALAVVLTGMGHDGLRGAEVLKARGAKVLAQDESTSVVWGMPGAVVKAGLADHVAALDQIGPSILTSAGLGA